MRPYIVKGFKISILSYYCVIRVRASGSTSRLGALGTGWGWSWGWSALRASSFVMFFWALRTARSLFSISFITTYLQNMNQEVWNLNLCNILPQKCSRAARLQCQSHMSLDHVAPPTSHFISGILSNRHVQTSLATSSIPRSRGVNALFCSFPNKIFKYKY